MDHELEVCNESNIPGNYQQEHPTVNELAQSPETLNHMVYKNTKMIELFEGLQEFCETDEEDIWLSIESDDYRPYELIIGYLQT